MKNMKIVLMLVVSSVLLVLGGFWYDLSFFSQIKLPEEIDLGSIQLTDKPIFTISIRNVNNSTVEVPRVYTSCGCTTVLEPTGGFSLKPNASIDIKVQFDTSSMHKSGDDVYHEIYILTSKPNEKEYIVKMKGKIQ